MLDSICARNLKQATEEEEEEKKQRAAEAAKDLVHLTGAGAMAASAVEEEEEEDDREAPPPQKFLCRHAAQQRRNAGSGPQGPSPPPESGQLHPLWCCPAPPVRMQVHRPQGPQRILLLLGSHVLHLPWLQVLPRHPLSAVAFV